MYFKREVTEESRLNIEKIFGRQKATMDGEKCCPGTTSHCNMDALVQRIECDYMTVCLMGFDECFPPRNTCVMKMGKKSFNDANLFMLFEGQMKMVFIPYWL